MKRSWAKPCWFERAVQSQLIFIQWERSCEHFCYGSALTVSFPQTSQTFWFNSSGSVVSWAANQSFSPFEVITRDYTATTNTLKCKVMLWKQAIKIKGRWGFTFIFTWGGVWVWHLKNTVKPLYSKKNCCSSSASFSRSQQATSYWARKCRNTNAQ